jgi:hypothetical protein
MLFWRLKVSEYAKEHSPVQKDFRVVKKCFFKRFDRLRQGALVPTGTPSLLNLCQLIRL